MDPVNPLKSKLLDPDAVWPKPQNGMVVQYDGTVKRVGRGRPRGKRSGYDVGFKDGQRYKVSFNSISDATCAVEFDLFATSLTRLLTATVREIGTLRKTRSTRHFTLTFKAYPNPSEAQNMQSDVVSVLDASPLEPSEAPPITSNEPLDKGLKL